MAKAVVPTRTRCQHCEGIEIRRHSCNSKTLAGPIFQAASINASPILMHGWISLHSPVIWTRQRTFVQMRLRQLGTPPSAITDCTCRAGNLCCRKFLRSESVLASCVALHLGKTVLAPHEPALLGVLFCVLLTLLSYPCISVALLRSGP